MSVDVSQSEVAPLESVGQFLVIDAELMQHRGMQIVNVDWILCDVIGVLVGCPVCHSERDWKMAGAPPLPPIGGGRPCYTSGENPPGMAGQGGFPGVICFRNITPHPTGVGEWSDGELMRAIREGIDKDGNTLFPTMPYFIYSNLADEDVKAVIAYLHTLPPVDHELPDTRINFPINIFVSLLPKPVNEEVPLPDKADTVAHGEYLTKVARCHF